jgi:hypothetical protein
MAIRPCAKTAERIKKYLAGGRRQWVRYFYKPQQRALVKAKSKKIAVATDKRK